MAAKSVLKPSVCVSKMIGDLLAVVAARSTREMSANTVGGLSSVEWQINLLREQEIVHVKATGVANVDAADEMVSEAFSAATKWNCTRFLVDGPDVDFSLGSIEIYDRPEALKDRGILPGRHRLAYVFSGQMDQMRFFENVLRNQGFVARIFSDFDSAIEWLTSQDI